jgi:hypothetical protein
MAALSDGGTCPQVPPDRSDTLQPSLIRGKPSLNRQKTALLQQCTDVISKCPFMSFPAAERRHDYLRYAGNRKTWIFPKVRSFFPTGILGC